MGIESKWQELYNSLVNWYESTSIYLWNEEKWFMFVWEITDC